MVALNSYEFISLCGGHQVLLFQAGALIYCILCWLFAADCCFLGDFHHCTQHITFFLLFLPPTFGVFHLIKFLPLFFASYFHNLIAFFAVF